MMHNKTPSACAADGYHGTHAEVDVGRVVRGKDVKHVDNVSNILVCVLASRPKSVALSLRSQRAATEITIAYAVLRFERSSTEGSPAGQEWQAWEVFAPGEKHFPKRTNQRGLGLAQTSRRSYALGFRLAH